MKQLRVLGVLVFFSLIQAPGALGGADATQGSNAKSAEEILKVPVRFLEGADRSAFGALALAQLRQASSKLQAKKAKGKTLSAAEQLRFLYEQLNPFVNSHPKRDAFLSEVLVTLPEGIFEAEKSDDRRIGKRLRDRAYRDITRTSKKLSTALAKSSSAEAVQAFELLKLLFQFYSLGWEGQAPLELDAGKELMKAVDLLIIKST